MQKNDLETSIMFIKFSTYKKVKKQGFSGIKFL